MGPISHSTYNIHQPFASNSAMKSVTHGLTAAAALAAVATLFDPVLRTATVPVIAGCSIGAHVEIIASRVFPSGISGFLGIVAAVSIASIIYDGLAEQVKKDS